MSVAAELETEEGRKVVAVSRDVSESGLLLLMHVALPIGTTFRLHVIRADQDPLIVGGRVVRTEPLELEYADVWSHKVGVELVDPPDDFLTALDAITAGD